MILQDTWVVPQTANPTHDFGGAANTWASVTIENDTTFSIAVNPQQGNPPTGLVDAWRVIPPGANVTWPLYSNGVSYRVLGTPSSPTVVQTVLSTDAAPAGGTTGSVNVASGSLTVSGPVTVENAAGVNLAVSYGFATDTIIGFLSGTTSHSVPLQDGVQRLVIQQGNGFEPTGLTALQVVVQGDDTGTRYWGGPLGGLDSISFYVNGLDSAHGIGVDASVTVTINAVGSGTLYVVQSYAPPSLSANDIYPRRTADPAQTFTKNLYVHEAHAKAVAFASVNSSTRVTIIPAPGATTAIQLHRTSAALTAALAGNIMQYQQGTTGLLNLSGAANGNWAQDWAGYTLPVNTAFNIQGGGTAPTANWDVTVLYSLVSTT